MAGEIQKLPWGLLGFFDIKSFGRYPNLLGDTYVPVLDEMWPLLETHYGENNQSNFTVNNAAAGAFIPGGTVVPVSEAWRVGWCHLSAVTVAAELCNFALAVRYAENQQVRIVSGVNAVGASQERAAVMGQQPMWLPPGTELGGYFFEVTTAATIELELATGFIRFPI